MNLRPFRNRLLVKPLPKDSTTSGGLIIPEIARERSTKPGSLIDGLYGEVIAVGKGQLLDDGSYRPLDVTVGNKIVYSDYVGEDVEIEGINYKLLHEEMILGIVE